MKSLGNKKVRRLAQCLVASVFVLASSAFSACAGGPQDNAPGTDDELPPVSELTDLTDERYCNLYGRNFYNDGLEGMTFVNSASGFEVRFSGTELTVSVQVITSGAAGYDCSMFSVFADGETDSNACIVSMPKTIGVFERHVLVEGLPEGEHTVRVLKRTPSNRDRCIVGQISTDGTFLAAPARPQISLDVYGDSITCGEGVMREVTYNPTTGKYADSAVYTAASSKVSCFEYGKEELFGAFNPAGITASRLERIEYTLPEGETVRLQAVSVPAEETEGDSAAYTTVWRLTDDPDAPLDQEAVDALLSALGGYVTGQITGADPSAYGFDQPLAAVSVSDGEKDYALAYASGADGYYLKVEGDGSVYTVDGTAAAAFVPAEELKS